MENITPTLDFEVLKEKTNEYAMKGALKTIEEFYNGHDSPYRKAIKEELKKGSLVGGIELPDVIGLINESLTAQINLIANEAIAKSFVPLVNKFLTRVEPEINFSDILKMFISELNIDYDDSYDISVEQSRYSWLEVTLEHMKHTYELTLHTALQSQEEKEQNKPITYQILSLPRIEGRHSSQKMKLRIGDGELEMPFQPDVLSDPFISYIARVCMSKSKITMDTRDFDEDWFERDECHCH